MTKEFMRQVRKHRPAPSQSSEVDLILEWIRGWNDGALAHEIERIETGAVDGKFESELTGKRYAVLLSERERRNLARAR